jgi:hypothetical protein
MKATSRIYPLVDILWYNLLGPWMKYVFSKIRNPNYRSHFLPHFCKGAPDWFKETWQWTHVWDNNLYDCNASNCDCRPSLNFALLFRAAARDRLEDWIANKSRGIAEPLVNAVSNLLGSLAHGYTTFSSWLEIIRSRVGTWKPWWSTNLANAADKLYSWLPASIRGNHSTWGELWESIKEDVRNWASLQFDAAKTWVANTAPWLITGYNTVRAWYDLVSTWITSFKNDPYGTVAGWLGIAWTYWLTIRDEIANFYNDVWIPFKVSLHDFLDHPVLWLYDRFDEEAENYIETLSRWVGRIAEKIITWSWENT